MGCVGFLEKCSRLTFLQVWGSVAAYLEDQLPLKGEEERTPSNLSCECLIRISQVILLELSMVIISLLSNSMLRPGWGQVLQYRCTDTSS